MRQSMDFFKKHPDEEILDLRKTRGGKLEGGGKLALIPLIFLPGFWMYPYFFRENEAFFEGFQTSKSDHVKYNHQMGI